MTSMEVNQLPSSTRDARNHLRLINQVASRFDAGKLSSPSGGDHRRRRIKYSNKMASDTTVLALVIKRQSRDNCVLLLCSSSLPSYPASFSRAHTCSHIKYIYFFEVHVKIDQFMQKQKKHLRHKLNNYFPLRICPTV